MRIDRLSVWLATALLAAIPASAHPPQVGTPIEVANGLNGPEGIAFLRRGGFVVGSVDGEIRRLTADGTSSTVANVGDRLAGITVARDGAILAAAFNADRVWRIDPDTGASVVAASGIDGPNVIAQSRRGRVYVSASVANTIVDISSGTPVVLASALNFPNGLAIGADHFLYVAETTMNRIVRLPIANDGTLGAPEVYATGLSLADGIALDQERNLPVVGFDTLSVVEAKTRTVRTLSTDPLLNWPSNIAFGHGRGFQHRDIFLVNFGPALGDGTNVIRLRYNHAGARLIR